MEVPTGLLQKRSKHLEDDHPAVRRISSMGTFEAFAFDVAAALVLCGLNALVSTPDDSIIKRIHLEIVSLETGL